MGCFLSLFFLLVLEHKGGSFPLRAEGLAGSKGQEEIIVYHLTELSNPFSLREFKYILY